MDPVAVISTGLLVLSTGATVVSWLIKTTRLWTEQLLKIERSIDYLKESDQQVINSIRQIEANDATQAQFIDGLIQKHLQFGEDLQSVKNEVQVVSENVQDVMQKLRMKPRSRSHLPETK